MDTFWMGLSLAVAGGVMQGSFALPQKRLRGWSWEQGWLFYSVAGMIVFPWLIAAFTIPDALGVYTRVDPVVVARAAVFGAGWGVGSVLFGLGIARVGMALAFAIIICLTAAVGSLVPLVVLHPEEAGSTRSAVLMLGLLIVIAGVALCGRAGALKEAGAAAATGKGSFARGLAICIASGVTSPMLNFSFAFGAPIADEAVRGGAEVSRASIAILALAISSGFVVNAGYCLALLKRNRSWAGGVTGRNLPWAAAMGFLWMFGMYFYGLGATEMGELGPVIGWPLFMTVMVLVANFWGVATGEWRNASRKALWHLGAGNAVMIVALAVIAWGSRA